MANTLYETFNVLVENELIDLEVPKLISENVSQDLRPYQIEALSRFEYYMTSFKKRNKPSHLLFNMATGSGKTLIMASTMLSLYEKGYRNFIFFVNSTSIIEKTKENFLNSLSSKYLFSDKIEIDNQEIVVNQVNNFQSIKDNAINIFFTTIQGLHTLINEPKENSLTLDDFENKEIVLLADEAHHINALTKKSKLTKTEETEKNSWEGTVSRIFEKNQNNLLLEFTATIDLSNPDIFEKYKDKIIYKYSLKEFREDRYSKEVQILSADIEEKERALTALILSQYRLKVAQKNHLVIKPTILMKSKTIDMSKDFENTFHNMIDSLTKKELQKIKDINEDNIVSKAFDFFENEKITLDNLAYEMKESFNHDKTVSVNSKDDTEEKQIIVNSLEDIDNRIRVIFAVDKLNEGWDVLNLYDIVRLYNTRDSNGKTVGKTTMAEAQLIGRGARYCPFNYNEEDKYKRKFDEDKTNEMRILEELYYHSEQNSRYITELHYALVETGIKASETKECELIIKDSFKETDFWKNGYIFLNKKRENTRNDIFGLEDKEISKSFKYTLKTNYSQSINAFGEEAETIKPKETKDKTFKINTFGINIIQKALSKNQFYQFNILKKYFPNLDSMKEFIESNKYLNDIEVEITATEDKFKHITNNDKLNILIDILNKIKIQVLSKDSDYIGTTEFEPHKIKDIFKEYRVLNISMGENQERGVAMSSTTNNTLNLDVNSKEWYIHTENFGTDQEKLLVRFINNYIEELEDKYNEVYLLRNEKDFKLHAFSDGRVFEPDFVLCFKENKTDLLISYQLFIEPKGANLIENDLWKENFLKEIEDMYNIPMATFHENKDFKLYGLPFYNKEEREVEFKNKFEEISK